MKNSLQTLQFKHGLKDGLPIGLGYLSVSFAFGVTATALGIPAFVAIITSMTNLTSAGQLAGVTIMSALGSFIELILAQLVINARYFLMSVSLSQKLDGSFSLPMRLICSVGITDEIFAVASSKKQVLNPKYFLGLMLLPYVCWATGTAMGALIGNVLPTYVNACLGIALYAMFIAIIVPPSIKSLGVTIVVLLSAALSCAFHFIPELSAIPSGFTVIICALVGAGIVAAIFPVKEDSE